MIQRIDLAPLLKEAVATPYSDLVTRPTGAFVRGRIEKAIVGSAHRATQLDFTAVGLLDMSCADEVVAKLLLWVTGEEEERYVVLSGVTDAHLDAIDSVLERHGLTIAAFPAGGGMPRLLGATTPDVLHAFQAVHRLGPGDAGRLADILGWTVERAADALQSLALRRLIQAAGGTFRPLAPA
ncbi:MAG: hypothetical protein ACRENB_13510 [Gemmatimonadales bacterium]